MYRSFIFLLVTAVLSLTINAANPDAVGYRTLTRKTVLSANQPDRVALVIGNSRYQFGPLKNPENDASDVATVLAEKLGFDVIVLNNQPLNGMVKAVREFEQRLKPGAVALLFYAGHGLQSAGINYMVPVDAEITHEDDIKRLALPLTDVLNAMEKRGKGINLIFLDACRNNPFAQSSRSSGGGGWGSMQDVISLGTQIVYATKPGSVASDGSGRNGVFTSALLQHMAIKGQPISEMISHVTADVAQRTSQKQIVWQEGSLTGGFQFIPGERPLPTIIDQPINLDPIRDSIFAQNDGPAMMPFKAGLFSMGAIDGNSDEQPVHSVAIRLPFAIGQTEITREQFARFVDDSHYVTVAEKIGACLAGEKIQENVNWKNPGFAQTGAHPVVCVTQTDANAFAQWLSKKTGARYRLPSEAEWEFAARAGGTQAYGASNSVADLCNFANGDAQKFDITSCQDNTKYTDMVAQRSAHGRLHDMLGNVWELTLDCYSPNYDETPRDGSAYLTAKCNAIVARGGSFMNSPKGLRVSVRAKGAIDAPATNFGFRLIRELP